MTVPTTISKMQVVHSVYSIYSNKFTERVDLFASSRHFVNRMMHRLWSQKMKPWLQRIDIKLGTWLCRKFPKLSPPTEIGFGAGQGFDADLQIKVIRKHEKESDPQNTGFRTFWNRLGTKR
jgi:hypothetical protein